LTVSVELNSLEAIKGMKHFARSDPTKNYKIDNCCFSAKHIALRSKSKDWLAQNQDNVRDPDKLHICVFYAMKTSKNAQQLSIL
jgi:hypothetical protein